MRPIGLALLAASAIRQRIDAGARLLLNLIWLSRLFSGDVLYSIARESMYRYNHGAARLAPESWSHLKPVAAIKFRILRR